MPHPADKDPERNHQEWHSAGGKIKVRPRIFERTLQILRTSVALKTVSWISIFMRRVSFDVPQNPYSDPKRSNCVLHSSKVYLHAHLAFQAHYFKWAWNCFKWTMAAFFKTVYLGEQTVEWLKSELFLLMMKRNRVQLLGMASALLQAKCWDVDFWHIVELGELLVVMVFIP